MGRRLCLHIATTHEGNGILFSWQQARLASEAARSGSEALGVATVTDGRQRTSGRLQRGVRGHDRQLLRSELLS